jgi:hypothetical protein
MAAGSFTITHTNNKSGYIRTYEAALLLFGMKTSTALVHTMQQSYYSAIKRQLKLFPACDAALLLFGMKASTALERADASCYCSA